MKDKIPSLYEMECCVAKKFGIREHIIVPNISWGMKLHECDLLVVTRAGYAIEVEIKRSMADLKKDASKGHMHKSDKIKELYFAIPEKLKDCENYIPQQAGIIHICKIDNYMFADIIRPALTNKNARKLSDSELITLARLSSMRIWDLKNKVVGLTNDVKYLRDENKSVA